MWHKAIIASTLRKESNLAGAPSGTVNKNDFGFETERIADGSFLKIFFRKENGGIADGWIASERVADAQEPPLPELDLPIFLKNCVSAEIWVNGLKATGPHTVLADYLIALASIESQTKNAGPLRKDSDGAGPFQIDSANWKRFTDGEPDKMFAASDRIDYLDQCYGAAFLTHLNVKELSDAIGNLGNDESGDVEKPGDVGPFVPSLSDVFLAHIIGAKAAAEMRKRIIGGRGANSVSDVLLPLQPGSPAEQAAALDALLRRRNDFLKVSADVPQTVEGMYDRVDSRLASELKEAFKLMKEHVPEDIPEPTGASTWMAAAGAERAVWSGPGVTEMTDAGKAKVREYFAATDSGITGMEPWCGAFVAFCLDKGGVKPVAGSARAANWKQWGSISLLGGNSDVPKGAVVVLSPTPGSQRSGHVGFFSEFLSDAGKPSVKLLGGNQSNTVKESVFPRARIADIRWHSDVNTQMMQAVTGATVTEFSPLIELIAEHESGGNYEAFIGNGGNTSNPKLTGMTIGEILRFQDKLVNSGHESGACGRYQIIKKTLKGLMAALKLAQADLFDAAMQDRLALQLLKQRGLGGFMEGKLTVEKFALEIAKEWASLPVLSPVIGHKGFKLKATQSFYAGVGSNEAGASIAEVKDALEAINS
jgi:uncharacterized protein (TIGR02594 family)